MYVYMHIYYIVDLLLHGPFACAVYIKVVRQYVSCTDNLFLK